MDGCWWHHAMSPLPALRAAPLAQHGGGCGLSRCAVQQPGSMWGPVGPQDQGGSVKANAVLQHIPELHRCGCKAACTGYVTWSLCIVPIHFPGCPAVAVQHSCNSYVWVVGEEPPVVRLSPNPSCR